MTLVRLRLSRPQEAGISDSSLAALFQPQWLRIGWPQYGIRTGHSTRSRRLQHLWKKSRWAGCWTYCTFLLHPAADSLQVHRWQISPALLRLVMQYLGK